MPSKSEYAIVPYLLHVEKAYERDENKREQFLTNFDGNGGSLLVYVSAFLEWLPKGQLHDKDSHHFGRPRAIERLGYTIRCKMQGGWSGVESFLSDATTGETLDRKKTTIEEMPFRFIVCAPANAKTGFLLVESHHGRYLTSATWQRLIRSFRARYPEYILSVNPVLQHDLWKKIESEKASVVKRVEVTRRGMSKKESQNLGAGASKRRTGQYTQILDISEAPENGRWLRRLRRTFTRKVADGGQLVQIKDPISTDDLSGNSDVVFNDDVLEITVTALFPDGVDRRVRFSGARTPRAVYEVPNPIGVVLTDTNFYTEARAHIKQLASVEGVTLDAKWDQGTWTHPVDVTFVE